MASRRSAPAGVEPLSPRRKWQTIAVATMLLVPAYWSVLAGIVDGAVNDADAVGGDVGNGPAFIAFGLALIPFVFIVLAFMSGHPKAPGAVVRAMGLSVLVGIVVSAVAADAVTGIVAGVGAGGAVALRPEPSVGWKPRAVGVLVASAYTFILVRTAGAIALVSAPIFPLTALGLADHFVAWRRQTRVAEDAARD
jgi:hypothetical protein